MARVCVRGVITLVVLDVDKDAVLVGGVEEELVVGEGFHGGLSYQDVDFPFNGVECNGVVRSVGGKDCDGGAGGEGVNCSFVGFGVAFVVGWEGVEGGIKAVVDLGDVFLQVFT